MKTPVILIFLLAVVTLSAQQVISPAGANGTGTTVQLSWTVGEPVVETFSAGNSILTQGFHQGKLVIYAADPLALPGLDLTVYPNPASSFLKLTLKATGIDDLNFSLCDINGKLMLQRKIENQTELIDMLKYPSGVYLLKVSGQADQVSNTFKIVKN
jgi:hypothetical protein